MGSYIAVLVFFVLIPLGAAFFGADSRLLDADRATRWWPADTRR